MSNDELFFFDGRLDALPLYEILLERLMRRLPGITYKTFKTQISFYNKRGFCCISFLPVRKKTERLRPYVTLSFGLSHRLGSQQIDAFVEPNANRWTHHIMISDVAQIDEELMCWLETAAEFSAGKC